MALPLVFSKQKIPYRGSVTLIFELERKLVCKQGKLDAYLSRLKCTIEQGFNNSAAVLDLRTLCFYAYKQLKSLHKLCQIVAKGYDEKWIKVLVT